MVCNYHLRFDVVALCGWADMRHQWVGRNDAHSVLLVLLGLLGYLRFRMVVLYGRVDVRHQWTERNGLRSRVLILLGLLWMFLQTVVCVVWEVYTGMDSEVVESGS